MAGVLWSQMAKYVCIIGGFWGFLFVYNQSATLLFVIEDEYHSI